MTQTSTAPPAGPPGAAAPQSRRAIYLAMAGLMLGILLAMLDNLIVSTALPTIVGDLGGLAHLSWVVTAYALAIAAATRSGASSATSTAARACSWRRSSSSCAARRWPGCRRTWAS